MLYLSHKRVGQARKSPSIREKLERRRVIDPTTGCWLWTGALHETGYGLLRVNRKMERVHRLAYEEYTGKVLLDFACHKSECPNKNCFNPEHLYDGTPADNVRDMQILGKLFASRTN